MIDPLPDSPIASGIDNVMLKSPNVVLQGVDAGLIQALKEIAAAHFAAFGLPVVVTSGRDGEHVPGSAHLKGKAVDIRSTDLNEAEQVTFTCILAYMCREREVGVFDERGLLSAPHWHLEVGMYGS